MSMAARFGVALAKRRSGAHESSEGSGAVVSAIFGLLGLLIAFTFASAYSRFETRRKLIIDEANAIGTTYLRLDLVPAASQPSLREKMKRYTESRVRSYQVIGDTAALTTELATGSALQKQIWNEMVVATQSIDGPTRSLVIAATNEMFDIADTRKAALLYHVPGEILLTLVLIAIFCAGLASYTSQASGGVSRLHSVSFALVTTFVLFVILDIEFPSKGWVSLDAYNQRLAELASEMK